MHCKYPLIRTGVHLVHVCTSNKSPCKLSTCENGILACFKSLHYTLCAYICIMLHTCIWKWPLRNGFEPTLLFECVVTSSHPTCTREKMWGRKGREDGESLVEWYYPVMVIDATHLSATQKSTQYLPSRDITCLFSLFLPRIFSRELAGDNLEMRLDVPLSRLILFTPSLLRMSMCSCLQQSCY